MRTYNTISEIKEANKAIDNHFFDAGALKFFNSKIYTEIIHGNLFITSERFDENSPRLFSVRCALTNGSIESLSKFQAFTTKQQAIRWAKTCPIRIQEAIECAHTEFNTGKKTGMGFLAHALIEPTNNRDHSFSMDSFAGACTWLLINWNSIDFTWLKAMAKEFEESLQADWLPVPTNSDAK
jgi:hypothetical protein